MAKVNYDNILIAVDGSEAANKAFQRALSLAKINDAKLIITHVIDTRAFATAEAYDQTIISQTEKYSEELIQTYVDQLKEAGISKYETKIDFGSPKVKIAKDIANEFDTDLIVCGATGLNAVERFLMGSVSESITRYATCDVLVVR
ncbi:MAG TPA: universal stress protein [Bacillota bacterium]|nr:universal stress protein [Bacillota bacterium]